MGREYWVNNNHSVLRSLKVIEIKMFIVLWRNTFAPPIMLSDGRGDFEKQEGKLWNHMECLGFDENNFSLK